jgi:hypothetical protein
VPADPNNTSAISTMAPAMPRGFCSSHRPIAAIHTRTRVIVRESLQDARRAGKPIACAPARRARLAEFPRKTVGEVINILSARCPHGQCVSPAV